MKELVQDGDGITFTAIRFILFFIIAVAAYFCIQVLPSDGSPARSHLIHGRFI